MNVSKKLLKLLVIVLFASLIMNSMPLMAMAEDTVSFLSVNSSEIGGLSLGAVSANFGGTSLPKSNPAYNGFIAPPNQDPIPADAIHIQTATQLAAIGGAQSAGKYYVLDNDINLIDEWVPIDGFNGIFDGQGHNINNLYVLKSSNRQYVGLFGQITGRGATIKNVGVNIGSEGLTASGSSVSAGGLVSNSNNLLNIANCFVVGDVSAYGTTCFVGGLVGNMPTGLINLENCFVMGDVFAHASQRVTVGGLIGWGLGSGVTSTVENCFVVGDVSASCSSYEAYAGGLIGDFLVIDIKNCHVIGDVTAFATASANAGGLAGRSIGAGSIKIMNCFVVGDVSASGSAPSAGGLLGYSYCTLEITSCYVMGVVSASHSVVSYAFAGGLVGYNSVGSTATTVITIKNCYVVDDVLASGSGYVYAGGLIGCGGGRGDIIIENCYVTGDVISSANAGDLFGVIDGYSTTVNSCYRISTQTVMGTTINTRGETLSPAQMRQQWSFVGWDFENIWAINPTVNNGYPHLKNLDSDPQLPDDVIHIRTVTQLAAIGGPESAGKYYVLDNDINLVNEWIPINDFRGTFDGRGHTINNLYILESSNRQHAGLFGQISSASVAIKNIGINIGSNGLTGTSLVGGLIGFVSGSVVVENCYVTGDVSGFSSGVGGLIGFVSSSSSSLVVENCYATGDVSGAFYVGGLIGYISSTMSVVENCYATGDVYSVSYHAGGLIGYVTSSSSAIVKNCYATGDVYSRSYGVGGLIGSVFVYGTGSVVVENCYATGNVSGSSSAGMGTDVGGLIGYVYVASSSSFMVKNSYRLSTQNIVGRPVNNLGNPLTPTQMRQQSSFVGWDFDNIWMFDLAMNYGYPYLQGVGGGQMYPKLLTMTIEAYINEIGSNIIEEILNGVNAQSVYKKYLDIVIQDVKKLSNDELKEIKYRNNGKDWDMFCENFNVLVKHYGMPLTDDSGNDNKFTQKVHYFRNTLNRAPTTLATLVNEKDKWNLVPIIGTKYHMYGIDGEYNIKFTSKGDGKYEAVYNIAGSDWKNAPLLNEDEFTQTPLSTTPSYHNMATYNYGKIDWISAALNELPIYNSDHDTLDVQPYNKWGNTEKDCPVDGKLPDDEDVSTKYEDSSEAKDRRSELVAWLDIPHVVRWMFLCPVDIEVYNGADELVCSIINNVVTENSENSVNSYVYNDVKYVYLQFNDVYTLNLIGTDNGVMDVHIIEFDLLTDQINSQKEFSNVILYDGKHMTSKIGGSIIASEVRLFVVEDGAVVAEVMEDGTEQSQIQYTITATAGEGGIISGYGIYEKGTLITLTATPDVGYVFGGWYESNLKVSEDLEYSFIVTTNRVLVARFMEDPKVVLKSISITVQPIKLVYLEGELLDFSGLVVTAVYSDDSTNVVTTLCVIDLADGTVLDIVGTQTITVSYTEDGVTKTVTFTVTVNSHEHDWAVKEIVEPTCEEQGYTVYECSYCGETKQDNYVPVIEHDYGEGTYTESSCGVDGFWTFTCSVCGDIHVEIDEGSALEHNYVSVVTTQPTCTFEGVMTYTCSNCDDSYTEPIEKLNHNYVDVVTEPTCEDKGYTTYTCSECGDSYIDDFVDALGHIWDEGVVTDPDCEHYIITHTCIICHQTYEEPGVTIGHQWDTEVTIPPTTETEGELTYTCSRCGKTFTEVIPKLPTGNTITVKDIEIAFEIIDGIFTLKPTQEQMTAILNVPDKEIIFDLQEYTGKYTSVALHVYGNWFKDISEKTITIKTDTGIYSVTTKQLWNNSDKPLLVTVSNGKLQFKNM